MPWSRKEATDAAMWGLATRTAELSTLITFDRVMGARIRPMWRMARITVLLAAFLLLQAPFALPAIAAFAHAGPHAGAVAPCDGMSTDHANGCACCPDGVASMAACMSVCTAAACIVPSLPQTRVQVSFAANALAPRPLASRSDPPPDPPPIA